MASASDNFTRADSTGLGANWTPQIGNFNVVSNAARLNGAVGVNDANMPYTATAPATSYYRAWARILSAGTGGSVVGPAVRSSNAALTYYSLTADGSTIYLSRYLAGVFTSLASISFASAGFAFGNYLRLTCQGTNPVLLTCEMSTNGTTWTPLAVGTSGVVTDNSGSRITATNFAGISGYGILSAGADLDDWGFEDVGAPPSVAITDAGDENYNPGETGISITGTGFEASQGSGAVYISPTNNVADAARVAQTVTGWSDTSAVVTIVAGSLPRGVNLYLFVVNNSGQSNASGHIVQIAVTEPTIANADDEQFTSGETGIVVTGARFLASKGSGGLFISPTDDIEDEDAVEQTTTAWADTSITFTAVRGSLPFLTNLYLFVANNSGESNSAGYVVQFVPRVFIRDTLENLSGGNPDSDGDVLLVWRQRPTVASPDPDQAFEVEFVDGELEQEIARGSLTPGDPVWGALFGDDPYPASAKRIVPDYE